MNCLNFVLEKVYRKQEESEKGVSFKKKKINEITQQF